MICKLRKKHKKKLLSLLNNYPYNNIFLIGHLYERDIDYPGLNYWGYFENGYLRSVLMEFCKRYICVFSLDLNFSEEFVFLLKNIIDKKETEYISGDIITIVNLLEKVSSISDKEYYCRYEQHNFCLLDNKKFKPIIKNKVKKATIKDLDKLIEFYKNAQHMDRSEQEIRENLKYNRIIIAELDNVIVSSALTNTETPSIGILGGIYTKPEYRSQGFSISCVSKLCMDLLNNKKEVCLFYNINDPITHNFYSKLGFNKIGDWIVVKIENQ